ncbi:MAG: zinc ribbon domain-containing protein [Ktedonobacteraceae bacterium]|nr:zinc ribbon domain-containing protein [Ktedonobacteraceae bacterium]
MYTCPRCKTELPVTAHFCYKCGFDQPHIGMMPAASFQEQLESEQVMPSPPPLPTAAEPSPSLEPPPAPHVQSPSSAEQEAKGLSLMQRYQVDQRKSRYTPPQRPIVSLNQITLGNLPVPGFQEQPPSPMAAAPLQAPPPANIPAPPVPVRPESLVATSRAAEQWHNSWRKRQRAEAGPAVGISRGQAAVPEPLLPMQNSILRMRAVIASGRKQHSRGRDLGFWLPIITMICLIGGLSAYIISTYLLSVPALSHHVAAAAQGQDPVIALTGTQTTTVAAGQSLTVHGERFAALDSITFTLATTLLNQRVSSSKKGTFDVTLVIPSSQPAGEYALQAQGMHMEKRAFLDLQVLPTAATNLTNTTQLNLSLLDGRTPLSSLTFRTIRGQADPPRETLVLTNVSDNTPLQWSAAPVANDGLNWLLIDDHRTTGKLNARGTDEIGISINSTGLVSAPYKAYKGDVVFTVVGQGQVIVPVLLYVQDIAIEVVVNPNPIIAVIQGGGACLPTTLTLINLSNQTIIWAANPYDKDQPYIHLDGQPTAQGTLSPSGQAGDSKALQLSCIGVHVGENLYNITVSYNVNAGGASLNVPVSVRNA